MTVKPQVDEEVDYFKSTSYGDHGQVGVAPGGKARVIATAEIARLFPDIRIVTTSYEPNHVDDQPTHAAVMENELKRRGVNPENITREEVSMSTLTQIVEMIKMAADNGWRRIVAVTNEYHKPRMQEMIKQIGKLFAHDVEFMKAYEIFEENQGEIALIAAEDVISMIDGRMKAVVDAARETDAYKAVVASEQKGLQDLREGRYKVRIPTKPEPDDNEETVEDRE